MIFDDKTWDTISKLGLSTVGVVALGWVLYQFNIVPAAEDRADAREERKSAAKALVETNREAIATGRSFAQSYEKMAAALDSQTTILREIRDDQKKFPAIREANAEPTRPGQP